MKQCDDVEVVVEMIDGRCSDGDNANVVTGTRKVHEMGRAD
jgi:hypothetical protein